LESSVIFQTWNDSEAELVRGILESHGIPCSVSSDITHHLVPLTVDGLGEIRLAVPQEAAEEALRIIQDYLSAGSANGPRLHPIDH
jgi:hypothetical protein